MSQPSTTALAGYHERLRPRWMNVLKGAIAAAAFALASVGGLVACGTTRHVLTTPGNPVPVARYFPNALLAEPLLLRAGNTHVTQPFAVSGSQERWTVALGFVRSDQALSAEERISGKTDICWTDSSIDPAPRPRTCTNNAPGFKLRWELLRDDGATVAEFTFDSLVRREGGTYAENAITRTLSGFTNQKAGTYRLRVTILRDANELDFLRPHILVDRPFFSSEASR